MQGLTAESYVTLEMTFASTRKSAPPDFYVNDINETLKVSIPLRGEYWRILPPGQYFIKVRFKAFSEYIYEECFL